MVFLSLLDTLLDTAWNISTTATAASSGGNGNGHGRRWRHPQHWKVHRTVRINSRVLSMIKSDRLTASNVRSGMAVCGSGDDDRPSRQPRSYTWQQVLPRQIHGSKKVFEPFGVLIQKVFVSLDPKGLPAKTLPAKSNPNNRNSTDDRRQVPYHHGYYPSVVNRRFSVNSPFRSPSPSIRCIRIQSSLIIISMQQHPRDNEQPSRRSYYIRREFHPARQAICLRRRHLAFYHCR